MPNFNKGSEHGAMTRKHEDAILRRAVSAEERACNLGAYLRYRYLLRLLWGR